MATTKKYPVEVQKRAAAMVGELGAGAFSDSPGRQAAGRAPGGTAVLGASGAGRRRAAVAFMLSDVLNPDERLAICS